MDSISKHFQEAHALLSVILSDQSFFHSIHQAGISMSDCIRNGGKVISCGNGGSMCDAMHFAEELTGRFRDDRPAFPAVCISDPSHITCTGNDYGFQYIFSRFVSGMGKKGDVLLGISTSGHSPNVIEAVKTAKGLGMATVCLTGKDGGQLADLCDIEIRVPWSGYADRIQEIHIKIIHVLIAQIEQALFQRKQ